MKRRQYLERVRPKDTREIVVIGDREFTCDEFKAGAQLRMARCDVLPAEFRALCHEFNVNAGDLALLAERGVSVAEARRLIERKVQR